jgi:hypothetical protein
MHVSSSGSLIMDKSGVKPIQWDMGYNSILKEPNYASQKKKTGLRIVTLQVCISDPMEQMKLHMDGSIRELSIKIGLMASISFVEITSIM